MKRNIKFVLGFTVVTAFLAVSNSNYANEPKGPSFSLTNEKSTLTWKGTKPGGMHYGTVDVVNGSMDTDGSTITGGNFAIDLNTIVCDDLKNETFNQKLVGHLKSEDFFDTENHPKAFFKIKEVKDYKKETEGFVSTHKITGDLTIRGITNEVSFPAKVNMQNNQVMAETAEIVLDRTLWNVNYNSKKLLGNLADNYINDEMIIALDLRFDIK